MNRMMVKSLYITDQNNIETWTPGLRHLYKTVNTLTEKITHKSGEVKSVCVSACLAALGVPLGNYHYTGSLFNQQREAILRRHGYAVRSRMSALGKYCTVGQARTKIKGFDDPRGTRYLICVNGYGYCHALLLDSEGKTVVDTAPRKRDKRRITSIKAVFKTGARHHE